MFWVASVFASVVAWGFASAPTQPLGDCAERIELHVPGGYSCLMRHSSETGHTVEAVAWLRERLGRRPQDAAGRVALGRLLARLGDPDARRELAAGIDAAVCASDPYAEVMGRLSYARQRVDDVVLARIDAELDAARRVADAQADPFLSIEVRIAGASMYRVLGMRLGEAEAALRTVQETFGEPRSTAQAVRFHSTWAAIAVSTGRLETAVHRYRRAATLARQAGELRMVARLRYNEAVALRRLARERGRSDDGEHVSALEAVIETGLRVGDAELVATARAMLGSTAPRERAIEALERCVEDRSAAPFYRVGCLRALAWHRAGEDEAEAEALITEALTGCEQPSRMVELAESLSLWSDVLWSGGDALGALADGLAAIEVVESMRSMQVDPVARARLSAAWSFAYYEAAGRALALTRGSPEGASFALELVERVRARALRDALVASDTPEPARPPPPLPVDRAVFETLRQHRAERHARTGVGLSGLASLGGPVVPAIQERLGLGEALLSFQLDDNPPFGSAPGLDGGGSWVIAITRETVSVHRLEDVSVLDGKIQTYLGLFSGDSSMLGLAGHAVEQALLGDALESLPPWVDQLVVIPDGPIHRLPLAALGTDPEGTPLVQRYGIWTVPSAALWLAWRDAGPVALDRPAHLFADPQLPATALASAFSPSRERVGLPLLPQARTEVELIARELGSLARIYTGPAASESQLADLALDGGLLHLATHAVVAPNDPERSALVLAADTASDGLTHTQEIAGQPRSEAIVVLAACRGADGLVLRGEGLFGLAMGFLQAGARTVVASLWPLSDEQSAPFFAAFYGRLADGQTTADALANTQREWIAAGRHPETWAGFVVLGDGAARPFSPQARRPELRGWMGFPLLFAGIACLVMAARARRRRTAP